MKKILVIMLFCISGIAFAQKPIFTSAKINSATIYSNSAELNHVASATIPSGTSEVIIKNVANYINESTIQIGVPSFVTVLSVQYTRNYVSEYEIDGNNPEIKKIRDSIVSLQKELSKIDNDKIALSKTIELLDKNQNVSGTNSGLNVAELIKLVDYYKVKRKELSNSILLLNENQTKLNEKINSLNSKLEFNINQTDKSSEGKLVVQVMTNVAGMVNFNINYITSNASWIPFYDLRSENINSTIDLSYKAKVVQNTGIDWKNVKLTLSSGNPTQNNTAPLLQAWFLRYGYPKYKEFNQAATSNTIQSLQGKVSGLMISDKNEAETSIVLRGNRSVSQNNESLVVIDGLISDSKTLQSIDPSLIKKTEIVKGEQAAALYGEAGRNGVIIVTTKTGLDDYTEINENQLNVSFEIDIPYDILSNGKVHSVALKDLKLPATYKYYAVPKAEKEAFLLAEISDYSKFNLLPGEANIIFEGMYVGKTMINPNQTSDTLNLSMGRDKKIAIKREKIADKSGTRFLSSYKEQTYTFDITIKNNKKEPIEMLLKDQYPISTDKEISIELLDNGKAKVNEETGILTWEIKLAAGETKKYRISYKVKYPKDKFIDNL
jgi:hypothetical protein